MDEYIKREAAISACYDGYADNRDDCAENIRKLPAADVVPVRHGRWLIKTIRGDKRTVCSECLSETGTCYEENYCPNCGARMDKDGDGE